MDIWFIILYICRPYTLYIQLFVASLCCHYNMP